MNDKRKLTPIGKIIKKRLVDLDMSQTELAEKVGTTSEYLSYIISGRRKGQKYIEKIFEALELDIDVLNSFNEKSDARDELNFKRL